MFTIFCGFHSDLAFVVLDEIMDWYFFGLTFLWFQSGLILCWCSVRLINSRQG